MEKFDIKIGATSEINQVVDVIKVFSRKSGNSRFPLKSKQQK